MRAGSPLRAVPGAVSRSRPSRRSLLGTTGAGLAGALALSGCGTGSAQREAPAGGGGAGFPAKVDHKYGSTTVPGPPKRIVTVGLTDHDTVLALGGTLVGVTNFYEEYEYGTWPWAKDALGDATFEVMPRPEGDKPNIELIAGMRPDLIIGQYSGLTKADYEKLSAIAPTVAQLGDHPDFGAPWEEMTLAIGRALGKEADAKELVAAVDRRFADAREKYPEFKGASAVVAEQFDTGFVVRSATDPRTRFLGSLGFELPEEIAKRAGTKDAAPFSREEFELLDRDLLLWNAGFTPSLRAELADDKVYRKLPAVREGRALIVDDKILSGALTWSTVLSLPYAIDKVAPMLAAAVDGEPATEPAGP